MKNNTKI